MKSKNVMSTFFKSSAIQINKLALKIAEYYEDHFIAINNSIGENIANLNFSNYIHFEKERIENSTDYQDIEVISKVDIYKFIKNIFNEDLRAHIESIFGFRYSVDYFVVYVNKNIPHQLKGNIYANEWHVDKLFTKNCIKICVLMEDVDITKGPMEYLTKDHTKEVLSKQNRTEINDCHKKLNTGRKGDVFIFPPNKMLHKAGVPEDGLTRRQMIVQLNPSKKWKVNSKLYEIQTLKEPNLPYLKNCFKSYQEI